LIVGCTGAREKSLAFFYLKISNMKNIPFESKLQGIADISKRNKAFKALSDVNKRKEIAFDALTLLLQEKIVAQAGIYWDVELKEIKDSVNNSKDFQKSLCDLSSIKDGECGVCARGALMLSTIRLGNEISPDDSDVANGSEDIIKGFDIDSFLEMEEEFEGTNVEDEWGDDEDEPLYNLPYEAGTNKKLACILGNVIENGYYNTSDDTDYVKLWKLKL
jgi:hypothetical protein